MLLPRSPATGKSVRMAWGGVWSRRAAKDRGEKVGRGCDMSELFCKDDEQSMDGDGNDVVCSCK